MNEYLRYHGIENKQTFFSSGQRCGIVEYILKTTSYGYDPFGLKTGIDKLIKKKLFTDAYPLHEASNLSYEMLVLYEVN